MLPVIALFINYKKVKSNSICYIILIYCIVFFLLDFTFDYYIDFFKKNRDLRKVYYLFYTLSEYISFTAILFLKIKNRSFRKSIFVLSFLFIVFQTLYYLKFRFKTLDSIPIGIETIIIFIFIIYYFIEKFKESNTSALYTNYIFWIITGILIYLGGSFFFNILAAHLSVQQADKYWALSFLTDIIKNVLITIAIFIYAANPMKNSINKSTSVPYLDMI